MTPLMPNRREFLRQSAIAAVATGPALRLVAAERVPEPLPVAGVVTVYTNNSHADVILGKILEGYDQQGGPGPALKLTSLYVDQEHPRDLSAELSARHGFRLVRTIDEALTLGTDRLRVAGVISIGEHGNYPDTPETKQTMYPRRRFFDGIAECFRRVGQVVPVFNDKHLAYRWSDARQMYDTARELQIPFMAGSSVPFTWRRPALELPLGCEIEEALVVGYGGAEAYGFHALEGLQCMVERRTKGESGVVAVQALRGNEIRQAAERGDWSSELLSAAFKTMPQTPEMNLDRLRPNAVFYRIEYRDGLRATVALANGVAREFGFAARLRGQHEPAACWFELEEQKPFGHFAHLTRGIEHLVHARQSPVPVERTLLTTGILDALMHSLADGGPRRETPELDVRYHPSDWPFANRNG